MQGQQKKKGKKTRGKVKSGKGKRSVKLKGEVLGKVKPKRINWSKGIPRKKMKKALKEYNRKDKELQLKGESESWTIGKLEKEREILRRRIVNIKWKVH